MTQEKRFARNIAIQMLTITEQIDLNRFKINSKFINLINSQIGRMGDSLVEGLKLLQKINRECRTKFVLVYEKNYLEN